MPDCRDNMEYFTYCIFFITYYVLVYMYMNDRKGYLSYSKQKSGGTHFGERTSEYKNRKTQK